MAIAVALGLTVALLYAALIFLAVWMSVHPIRVMQYVSPGMLGYPQEDAAFTTRDGIALTGWLSRGDAPLVVIAVHGYLMNRCEWVPLQVSLAQTGASFLYFDLRAHGWSGGSKSTLGRSEALDVEAAIDFVQAEFPGSQIVLLGSSMGGVACLLAASERKEAVTGLMLDGAFRSLEEAVRGWWPFILGKTAGIILKPTEWLGPLVMGFRPRDVHCAEALQSLAGKPILLLYGSRDPLVPPASAQANLADAGEHARLVVFEGSTHGTARMREPERFASELKRYLNDLSRGETPGPTAPSDTSE